MEAALRSISVFAKADYKGLYYRKRELTDLCYASGLECWWAPELLLVHDKAQWVEPIPGERLIHPTPDGLLGTMFPRFLQDTLRTSDKNIPWSDESFNE